jgi:mRNA interferase MazF
MRRGDIITVAGGVYANKPRPALVVQDDRFDATESVTVCPFTSTEVDAPLLRVPVTADEANGLDQDSYLMVDKITTVRRSSARGVVGRLEATTMVEFERRLLVFLGFGT